MPGPELTVNTTGNPYVEVFFDPADLNVATARIRIYRFSDNRTWLVRGGVDVAPGVAAVDFEAPFGVPSVYRAEQFDSAGASLGYTPSSTATLDVTVPWVHNPLYPGEAVQLGEYALLKGTASKTTRPLIGDAYQTQGSTVATWIGSRRRGLVGLPVGFAVDSLEAMDGLQRMLGDYDAPRVGVLCLRTPPPVRIPRTLFTTAQEPEEQFGNTQWGGERSNFWFTGIEVKPPFPGIVESLLSYADLDAAYATYSARDAAYASYYDQDRDYSLAGLAD